MAGTRCSARRRWCSACPRGRGLGGERVLVDSPFSHIDGNGKLRMVDVSNKRRTLRKAWARCQVVTDVKLASLERRHDGLDVVHAARVAGVLAAKRTAEIIPLCHTLHLSDVNVELTEVSSSVVATESTGVEMEALTACAFAALSILDALTALDPEARIDDLVLLRKEGGKSGSWGRLVEAPTKRRRRRSS
jgi:cyclic pyranopterin phosphate synthase